MAERTALEECRQRLETSIHNFHSKVDTMMEGLEHEDLSLRPVTEDLPIEGMLMKILMNGRQWGQST